MITRILVTQKDGQKFKADSSQFPNSSFENLEQWKQTQIQNNAWGKPERWVRPDSGEDLSQALTSRPIEGEDEGNLEYKMPAEYTVEESDVTEEIEGQKAIEDTRSDRQFCLDMIDEIATFNKGNASDEQVLTLFTDIKYVGIIAALLSGGGKPAKQLMALHGPALYPQEVVNLFVAKLDQRFPG